MVNKVISSHQKLICAWARHVVICPAMAIRRPAMQAEDSTQVAALSYPSRTMHIATDRGAGWAQEGAVTRCRRRFAGCKYSMPQGTLFQAS